MATSTIIIAVLVLLVGALLVMVVWLWPYRPRKKPTVKYQSWEYPTIGRGKKVEPNVSVKSKPLIERLQPYAIVIGVLGTLTYQAVNTYNNWPSNETEAQGIQEDGPLIQLIERRSPPLPDSTNLACIDTYVQKSTTYE